MNMQLRQCFFRSQAFPTEKKPEKARFCLAFFDLQKKPEFEYLASKMPNWQPCNRLKPWCGGMPGTLYV